MFKKISKLLSVCVLAAALAAGSAVSVSAAVDTEATEDTYPVDSDSWTGWPAAPDILGVTGCVLDVNTGNYLYEKGMDVERFPASITKIMTAIIVMDHADLNAQVSFTETGLADAYEGSSNINPQLGETFTVDQMLEMLLVKSANDVSSQLAEYVAGSVSAFADMMNERAAELGCTNTHFTNACGLEDDNHYTTAHDMAIIMNEALQYDRIREIMEAQSISIPATDYTEARYYTTHILMIQPESEYYYEGALGGKTGYTPISGCTLVMYAQRGDRTLIGVVMGGGDSNLITLDMAALFDYGFDSFSYVDMTDGYPCISGGTALLPAGIDTDLVDVVTEETAEGISLSFQLNGQEYGTGLMTEEAYETWQSAKAAAESAEELESEGIPASETETTAVTEESGSKTIMYVIIAVLIAAIVGIIILIFLSTDRHQKKKQKKRRQRSRRDD